MKIYSCDSNMLGYSGPTSGRMIRARAGAVPLFIMIAPYRLSMQSVTLPTFAEHRIFVGNSGSMAE